MATTSPLVESGEHMSLSKIQISKIIAIEDVLGKLTERIDCLSNLLLVHALHSNILANNFLDTIKILNHMSAIV